MSEWMVRGGEVGDLAAVLAVERGCVGAAHWSQEIWADALSTVEQRRNVFVAAMGTVIVGFVVVSLGLEAAEIESVAVIRGARRKGVGRALCVAAMGWAREVGAAAMELEVRASTRAAMGLYVSLGFVEQGRRRGYYREPVDDAVLMRAAL